MNNFFIETCDNFFPPLIKRKFIANYLSTGSKFQYQAEVTYSNPKIKQGWMKYNNIANVEAFGMKIDQTVETYKELENDLTTFIHIKFNIKVKQITRMRLFYIPPNPNFDDETILGPHVDDATREHMTLLYYLFDNDADTLFFDKIHKPNMSSEHDYHKVNIRQRVEVKENRAVLFNGLIYHAGNVSKYSKRITLNCNFIPEIAQNT